MENFKQEAVSENVSLPFLSSEPSVVDILITAAIFFFLIGVSPFFNHEIHNIFPNLDPIFIGYQIIIIIFFFLNGWMIFRNGGLNSPEFKYKERDSIVLIIGFVLVVMYYEIAFWPQGIQTDLTQKINSLKGFEFAILIFELVILVPILEELLYRRFYLEVLKNRYHVCLAIFFVMIIETSFHIGYELPELIAISCWSLIGSIIYLSSRLEVSVLIHGAYNGLLVLSSRMWMN